MLFGHDLSGLFSSEKRSACIWQNWFPTNHWRFLLLHRWLVFGANYQLPKQSCRLSGFPEITEVLRFFIAEFMSFGPCMEVGKLYDLNIAIILNLYEILPLLRYFSLLLFVTFLLENRIRAGSQTVTRNTTFKIARCKIQNLFKSLSFN